MIYLPLDQLLDSLQTGFRRSNSTLTALIKFCDVRQAIDRRMITLILFDFSKAFDSVD